MHIGIVVGEASGDILGAGLIQVLKKRFPNTVFSGIGGDRMLSEGFNSLYPQDHLAVMGFIEPLKRLPQLLSIRKRLYHYFLDHKIDVFVGIDSPDFNLTLEKKLRKKSIKTVHYVSPSVWAWRQGRIKLIKEAVDLMLTLFPFEAEFYHQHNVQVAFVGHPLADDLPLENDISHAREVLTAIVPEMSFERRKTVIACLPGSRQGEIERIGPVLWESMEQLLQQQSDVQIMVPALNQDRYQQISQQLEIFSDLPITLLKGHSQEVMAAADYVLVASGTTTLEAMLLKKPMVVVYKKDELFCWIISKLLKVDYISLPNLLANERLVPEFLQQSANPDNISKALLGWMENPDRLSQLKSKFTFLHRQLRLNASEGAADAIIKLIEK
ncbi:lipid-A-disaccharide synthase [Candidatus Endobugula sertula]|uniref:Lipid-A-disaccharide synthase n=1 Tax=Candidatus Endobugula sertula TaxID=62101 RepID=A0A1D2QQR4_9GAMM|nr:lipid-A-disaccharide synthase [Candidatus Endobugula sertula]